MAVTVHLGDNRDILKGLPDAAVDSVVCDPPYGLGKAPPAEVLAYVLTEWIAGRDVDVRGAGFMGRKWDAFVPGPEVWRECLRVLKPGGHLLAFFGTRTYDLGALAVRLAGFEIRDMVAWLYGSGFPKHAAALKPALEPVVFARKPVVGTLAANVLAHGTGALNIDGCRIAGEINEGPAVLHQSDNGVAMGASSARLRKMGGGAQSPLGRWPANVIHDGSSEVVSAFPDGGGNDKRVGIDPGRRPGGFAGVGASSGSTVPNGALYGDVGSAARFFYAVEKDAHCDLCRALLASERAKDSPCNASTAVQPSSTQSTLTDAIARAGAMGSPRPAPEVSARRPRASATSAESSSSGCLQPDSGSVPSPAPISEASSLARNVRSAADLCGSCATAIAQSLAATRRGQNPASLPCPASIDGRSWQILTSSLALHVEGRESTDTTTTIPSLKLLLGSVFHAIGDTTRPAKSAALENTESGPKRFHYSSKADAADRCGSKHPTVKPVDLMAYLCRLVTPKGGTVLDPFAGSGSTGMACLREGFDCILIEREAEYVADIHRRLKHVAGADLPLFETAP